MKNLQNVKTVAKELGISKGKIKDMIRNKDIQFTLENGHYMVDIEVVKNILLNPKRSKSKKQTIYKNTEDMVYNYLNDLTKELLSSIENNWKNNVKDTDIVTVLRRTLLRNKQANNNPAASILIDMALDSNDKSLIANFIIPNALELNITLADDIYALVNIKQTCELFTNNIDTSNHTKSPHSVNGHWRNQPYGPRNNPKYKKIWIEEFDKGVA